MVEAGGADGLGSIRAAVEIRFGRKGGENGTRETVLLLWVSHVGPDGGSARARNLGDVCLQEWQLSHLWRALSAY